MIPWVQLRKRLSTNFPLTWEQTGKFSSPLNSSHSRQFSLQPTQVDWVRLSSAIERNRTHRKEKKSIEPNRTFDFRTRDLCKTDVENPLPDLRSSSYFSPECSARVFRKRRNSAEMASDALWIVSFKCIVKGYQECRFDVKDGEVFRVCSVLFS